MGLQTQWLVGYTDPLVATHTHTYLLHKAATVTVRLHVGRVDDLRRPQLPKVLRAPADGRRLGLRDDVDDGVRAIFGTFLSEQNGVSSLCEWEVEKMGYEKFPPLPIHGRGMISFEWSLVCLSVLQKMLINIWRVRPMWMKFSVGC